uniref:Small ArfGAP 1 n=1 Tax=Cairina moschata TaxID=8855 RepID=A0A8C3BXX8_CAIMO
MATRSCREKAQKQNEQHQAILAKLLREEDNKYCADCEAKGPRWASWNTGVFICIRCAGIHRNLGVHISRVKSVNLDQWTPEQIQCMQEMGNTKARLLYEANLPENFRRPQTDQAVEFFIRDKYEKKKYYDKNAVNTFNVSKHTLYFSENLLVIFFSFLKPQKKEDQQLEAKASPKKSSEPTIDLLGLDGPAEASVTNGGTATAAALNDDLDIFGPMISNPLPAAAVSPAQSASTKPAAATLSTASGDLDLFTEQTTKSEESAKKQLSKDSILSLYGTGTMQQQNAPGQAPSYFCTTCTPDNTISMLIFRGITAFWLIVCCFSVPVLTRLVYASQMNQQMAGMNLSSSSNVMGFGQPPSTVAGWTGSSSGQTLSTQLWK